MNTRHIDAIECSAPEIEAGLGELGFPFYMYEPEYRLRVPGACGVVSEAIRQNLTGHGYEAFLGVRSLPESPQSRTEQHVIVVVETDAAPLIVDGSYGQLFAPFGMDQWEAERIGKDIFPARKLLSFEASDNHVVAEWMSEVVSTFGLRYGHLEAVRRQAEARRYFTGMWDLSEYIPWEPSDYIRHDAEKLAGRIEQPV